MLCVVYSVHIRVTGIIWLPYCVIVCGWVFDMTVHKPAQAVKEGGGTVVGEAVNWCHTPSPHRVVSDLMRAVYFILTYIVTN